MSLGVNQMCTKMNEHAPTNGCAEYMFKKGSFEKGGGELKFDYSGVFSCLRLFFPEKKTIFDEITMITIILCHEPLPFSTIAQLLPLPPQNMLDCVIG